MVIAFIGLGEVGSTYSSGLARNGATVKGYDIKFDTEGKENFVNLSEVPGCRRAAGGLPQGADRGL